MSIPLKTAIIAALFDADGHSSYSLCVFGGLGMNALVRFTYSS